MSATVEPGASQPALVLGTAQWGMDYGATNALGRPSDAALVSLVETARSSGITCLDTAPAYGDAEARVGEFGDSFDVQTKVLAADGAASRIATSLEASLTRLGRSSVDSVLVHDWALVAAQDRLAVAREVEALRDAGLAGRVGVSGYDEADIEAALDAFERLDIVQVPSSVLDQRLVGSAALARVRSLGGRVQVRSVFLQGAALAAPAHPMFGSHRDVAALRATGDPLELCLGYVAAQEWIDEVVIGVSTQDELREICAAWGSARTDLDWPDLASDDPWLLDPRQWTAPTARG